MLRQQIISILFVDLRLTLLVVARNLRDAHRNVVQILLKQRLQFALHVAFVQMVHRFVRRYDEAGAELDEYPDHIVDAFLEANHVVLDVDHGQHGFSID